METQPSAVSSTRPSSVASGTWSPPTLSVRVGGPENTVPLAPELTEGRRTEPTDPAKFDTLGLIPAVDYGQYPVAEEAASGVPFHARTFLWETIVHWLQPWTVPAVFFKDGWVGLEMHSMARRRQRTDTTLQQVSRSRTFIGNTVGGPVSWIGRVLLQMFVVQLPMMLTVVNVGLGLIPSDSPVLVDVALLLLLELAASMVRGFKYAYRSTVPAARSRLLDHASRRHEELSCWIMLPEDFAVYLIRLAASTVGLDLATPCILEDPAARQWGDDESPTPLADLPFLKTASEVAPELLQLAERRPDGSVSVPVAAVLLELVVPLCATRYTSDVEAKSYCTVLGPGAYAVMQFERKSAFVVASLPTLLRLAFQRDRDWIKGLNWAEWLASVQCFASLAMVSMVLICLLFHGMALVFRRRRHLIVRLCGLLTGECPGFGTWRLSMDYSQVDVWNRLREMVLVFGKNYERRSYSVFALIFVVVMGVKVYCLFLFLEATLSGGKICIRDRPVTVGMVALVPFIFAPGIVNALAEGATWNSQAKRLLRLAIIRRRKDLVAAQVALNSTANLMFEADRTMRNSFRCSAASVASDAGAAPTMSGAMSMRCLEAADIESRAKRYDLVEQAYDHLLDEVGTMKNSVLLGWGGDGLFELSHALVLQYVSESILNVAFLSQAVTMK